MEEDLLERLGQEEALLDIVVGWVGRVDILDPGEPPADPAVLIYSLEGETESSTVNHHTLALYTLTY